MLPAEDSEEAAAARAAVLALRRESGMAVAGAAWAVGPGQLRISETSGVRSRDRRGLSVPAGAGLIGKVLTTGRPAAVSDYRSAQRISHEYDSFVVAEGVRAMAAAPVIVGSAVRAVLFVGSRDVARLGDRVLTAVTRAARDLEQFLACREQVPRLLSEARAGGVGTTPRGGPARERVHEAHTELLQFTATLGDPRLREHFDEVCRLLEQGCCAEEPEASPPRRPTRLSPRELDVLAAVAAGCTNLDISGRLDIGLETVKGYLRSAMRKLGTTTRFEAVTAARRAGLLP
ncbi:MULTISPECIES: LuxR C-terminal-related transcriptional regulator [Streptomyces]|uniref:Putative response regulator n=1 Tax=Streptomyces scabiei (strain 87.22) TaxID=680198 RepID=C9Z347_STRSW|nr:MULTISPECIES: LuxR C-terminal-related transcriptional regulator [Streptomyces]MBP5865765.1 GAF domain-containing protein [Streptomyces sp. LBUM 1484]MBP5933864.1 GAF domain-containing protein [Streptomyces sp. LBUM 1479]KFG04147.1 response regulator [Streptomyces scabiei]MBP5881208.1 GAF domain-containing protein [Streptomyces sp. LBUM 1487]MBP5895920.1 GAF domain-containing protein [Streptomyces sp. LBUM 1481]